MAYTLDRTVTAHDLLAVKVASGIELRHEEGAPMTLRAAVVALCSLGYGGHYDEESDEESAALDALGHDARERVALHDARADLAERIRSAAFVAASVWEVS